MIKVGDKVIHYVTGEEFTICDISISNVWLRKDTGHIDCTDRQFVYQCWYEAEKKRADVVEANWERLKKWLDEGVINQSSKYDKTGVPAFKHFRIVLESTQEKMQKLERGEE